MAHQIPSKFLGGTKSRCWWLECGNPESCGGYMTAYQIGRTCKLAAFNWRFKLENSKGYFNPGV